jgi:membrane associated rhomboid family serine protease
MAGNTIWEDIKYKFSYGDMVTKLIFVNVGIFVVMQLFYLSCWIAQASGIYTLVENKLELPAHLYTLARQPWALVTYMFLHADVFHILFNMLFLYWFGEIFVLYLGDRKILPLYLLGGITGGVLYIASYNLLPVLAPALNGALLLGASASIMAIVFGAATLNPEHEVRVMFLGNIKIKYITLAYFIIDLISIPYGNTGGYIAHIGGAIFGMLFVRGLRNGIDVSRPMSRFAEAVTEQFKPKTKMEVTHRNITPGTAQQKTTRQNDEERMNDILDKISRSGFDSLSKDEKDFLNRISQ